VNAAGTSAPIDWRFDTPRLQGRLVDERDRDVYRALYTDPAMMAHIGPALGRDAADALHAKVCVWNRETPMRARYWRMALRDTDEPVGMQSILRSADAPDCVELGLMVLPQYQGMQYGLEITAGVLDALFDPHWALDIDTVIARHLPTPRFVGRLGELLRFDACRLPGPDASGLRLTRAIWAAARGEGGAP
jgi:RimJ/RimL family protein N-acetyltransferase